MQALTEAGYTKTLHASPRLKFAILDHDVGPDGIGHLQKLIPLERFGVPVFMIPHAARPTVFWDGIYDIWPHTICTFVIAEGHKEVMNRYGYPLPIEVSGWPFCPIKPYRPAKKVSKILFGPIHPNTNGWLCDVDRDINRKAFERLWKYCQETGAELTVRYIRQLEANGLREVAGVKYLKAVPDGSTKEIDEADLVVSHQTFAYLAVARGRPTLMMGEDVPPRSGNAPENLRYVNHWDKYADLMAYPMDILHGDTAELIEKVTQSDADIVKWRSDMIGKPFNGPEFVNKLESYLPQARQVKRTALRETRAAEPRRRRVNRPEIKVNPVQIKREINPLKVLIYCAMFPTKPGIYPATLNSLLDLDWNAPYEIVFGKNDTFTPGTIEEKHSDINQKYNQARTMVLQGGYDALFIVEADMIVPHDALTRLAALDTDVAYGLYASRHSNKWYLYMPGPKKKISASRNKEFRLEVWGKVVETAGLGTGCTLIHRRVLEKIAFHVKPGAACDWYFSLDCEKHGFRQVHDCGLVCGHIHEGEILWPDPYKIIRKEAMLEGR